MIAFKRIPMMEHDGAHYEPFVGKANVSLTCRRRVIFTGVTVVIRNRAFNIDQEEIAFDRQSAAKSANGTFARGRVMMEVWKEGFGICVK